MPGRALKAAVIIVAAGVMTAVATPAYAGPGITTVSVSFDGIERGIAQYDPGQNLFIACDRNADGLPVGARFTYTTKGQEKRGTYWHTGGVDQNGPLGRGCSMWSAPVDENTAVYFQACVRTQASAELCSKVEKTTA